MDADDFIKERRLGEATGWTSWNQNRCTLCGGFKGEDKASRYEVKTHQEPIPGPCAKCLNRSLKGQPTTTEPRVERPAICKWCYKNPIIVGSWCRECRDMHQEKIIRSAIDLVKSGKASADQLNELRWMVERFEVGKKFKEELEEIARSKESK